jgi:hypothetical protein
MRITKTFIVVPFLLLTLLLAIAAFPSTASAQPNLLCTTEGTGVVDKQPSAAFTVTIGFKNTGTTAGNWSVNITFEGDSWSWTGTAQVLTLAAGASKTLTWTGNVPSNAPIDSFARLVVYYGGSFTALNWWIHVAPNAQVCIVSSSVT